MQDLCRALFTGSVNNASSKTMRHDLRRSKLDANDASQQRALYLENDAEKHPVMITRTYESLVDL